MFKYSLTIGKNDKDLKRQVLTNESIESLVSSALHHNNIECFTMLECVGFYTYENGQNVKEKSIRIEICTNKNIDLNVKNTIELLKSSLNQECIMVEKEKKDISFL